MKCNSQSPSGCCELSAAIGTELILHCDVPRRVHQDQLPPGDQISCLCSNFVAELLNALCPALGAEMLSVSQATRVCASCFYS